MIPCQKLSKKEGTARRINTLCSAFLFQQFLALVIPTSYFIFNILTYVSLIFPNHKYGRRLASVVTRLGTYYSACTDKDASSIRTKWQLAHPETPVVLSVLLYLKQPGLRTRCYMCTSLECKHRIYSYIHDLLLPAYGSEVILAYTGNEKH